MTTNGSTGINNYNEKYLIRVYKDGVLIFSQNDLPTERTWNTETFDFSAHPEFRVDQVSTFTFELYGYCIVDQGGTPGWELDDIKLLGGECPSSAVASNVSYLWSTGETTGTINVTPNITTTYTVKVTDCNGCSAMASKTVTVYPLPVPAITGNNVICNGETTTLTASGGTSYS